MDADDIAYPGRLKEQYNLLRDCNSDICFCSAIIEDVKYQKYKKWEHHNCWPLTYWQSLFSNMYGLHSTVMFNRNKIMELGGYNETYYYAQDYDLWDRSAAAGLKFCYVNTPQLCYRIYENGISRNKLDAQQKFAHLISVRAIKRYLHLKEEARFSDIRAFFGRVISPNEKPPICYSTVLNDCRTLISNFCSKEVPIDQRKIIYQDYARSILFSFKYCSKKGLLLLVMEIIRIIARGYIPPKILFDNLSKFLYRK
jgi:hypothetical protein